MVRFVWVALSYSKSLVATHKKYDYIALCTSQRAQEVGALFDSYLAMSPSPCGTCTYRINKHLGIVIDPQEGIIYTIKC